MKRTLDLNQLEKLADRFKILSEASRLRILQAICHRERSVGEICDLTQLNQANVSKHLQLLKSSGVVAYRRVGISRYYRIIDLELLDLCSQGDRDYRARILNLSPFITSSIYQSMVGSKEFIIKSLKLYRRYDMTTRLVTHPLKTGKLTAMSNVTSITVTGHQVSILEDEPEPGTKDCSAVHLTFHCERGSELRSISNRRGDVECPQKLPSLLATAEELGLIMDRDDAVEISLSLLAMALEDKTAADIDAIKTRLSSAIAELHNC